MSYSAFVILCFCLLGLAVVAGVLFVLVGVVGVLWDWIRHGGREQRQ